MEIYVLLLMAVGLSMDAFAVSVSDGMVLCQVHMRKNLKIAAVFGIFQGLMPLVGYTIASQFSSQIESVDHWIAFGLLVFIGGKMLWETFKGGEEKTSVDDPSKWGNLFIAAVATSIDALAVGISVAVMPKTGILASSYGYLLSFAIIAVITFVISFVGVMLGCRVGDKFGKKAEIAGGLILIAIGVKILAEHLMA